MSYHDSLYEKVNIEKFIERACDMSFVELRKSIQQDIAWIDSIRYGKDSPWKELKWAVLKYRDFIHEFDFILATGMKPAGMPGEDFQRTKPIIENLIARKEWKPEALNLFTASI